tara:strand:+ start:615 stop:1163 length:549 start_codon:yes stop_codon:yes gene_type:complete
VFFQQKEHMESNKNLVLVGMMGSGKSTIGYLLSKKLNIKFVDIDRYIEKEVGLKITDIFHKKGENYFREIEEKISLQIMKINNQIIALGGGGFMNQKIRSGIMANHLSFWLNWSNFTLIKRLKTSKKRPLILNLSEKEVKKIIYERSKIYSKANYKINCEKFSKNEIVKKIINIYNEHKIID